MASVERTAYPRFKRLPSARELRGGFPNTSTVIAARPRGPAASKYRGQKSEKDRLKDELERDLRVLSEIDTAFGTAA
ncbi:hypothetical protein [Streptomyces sp. NBC_01483]|uniref:hypothetical protein n=1 Tax=Streptomyces sp. NBC_01483 TaxID=2903883 RepID=UPI002E34C077|nr:hypothetical protein [Streptomyces sp. NBC_01483]